MCATLESGKACIDCSAEQANEPRCSGIRSSQKVAKNARHWVSAAASLSARCPSRPAGTSRRRLGPGSAAS